VNTQDKFTNALRAIANGARLDLIQDEQYANVGTFRVQAPGRVDDLLTLRYNFQSFGTHTFVLARPAHPPRDMYLRGDELQTVLNAVQNAVNEYKGVRE
jgi:hypothetical protein